MVLGVEVQEEVAVPKIVVAPAMLVFSHPREGSKPPSMTTLLGMVTIGLLKV